MPDCIIRPLVSSDRAEVVAFFAEMGKESTGFFNSNGKNERTALRYLDGEYPYHFFWAADDNGTLAGIVFLWDIESAVPWLGIAVRDSYHGKHIGTAMLEYVLDYTRCSGCGGVLLTTAQTNYKAQGLYEKCGFERLGVHQSGEFLYLRRFKN